VKDEVPPEVPDQRNVSGESVTIRVDGSFPPELSLQCAPREIVFCVGEDLGVGG